MLGLSVLCCRPTFTDARLHETLLRIGREVLQLLLQRLHKQGTVFERGMLPVPFSARFSERSQSKVGLTITALGAMCAQLHRQVLKALGESGSAIRGTKCRYVFPK